MNFDLYYFPMQTNVDTKNTLENTLKDKKKNKITKKSLQNLNGL